MACQSSTTVVGAVSLSPLLGGLPQVRVQGSPPFEHRMMGFRLLFSDPDGGKPRHIPLALQDDGNASRRRSTGFAGIPMGRFWNLMSNLVLPRLLNLSNL